MENTKIKSPLKAIRANKVRAALTTLGIVIGITSVVLMSTAIKGIDNAFQFLFADNIGEKACKKGSGAQGYNAQVENDPQGKGKDIAHVRLVQAFYETEAGGQPTPGQNCQPWQ